jgi:hypothetical protein
MSSLTVISPLWAALHLLCNANMGGRGVCLVVLAGQNGFRQKKKSVK